MLRSTLKVTSPFNAEVFPGSSSKARRWSVSVGIPVCCSWCEHHIHAYSDAWSWSRLLLKKYPCPMVVNYFSSLDFWLTITFWLPLNREEVWMSKGNCLLLIWIDSILLLRCSNETHLMYSQHFQIGTWVSGK